MAEGVVGKIVAIVFAFATAGFSSEYFRHTAEVSNTLVLKSSPYKGHVFQWKFNDQVLFLGGLQFSHRFSNTVSILPNNSLLISPIALQHEGVYVLVIDSFEAVKHEVIVEGRNILVLIICRISHFQHKGVFDDSSTRPRQYIICNCICRISRCNDYLIG